jgi:hypothetical protein
VRGVLQQCLDWKDEVFVDPSQRVDLKKFRLRRVPHALSDEQKSERVPNSRLLLTMQMEHKPTGFEPVMTGDEL